MKTVEERFWSKVDKVSSRVKYKGTRCWVWTACKHERGYGLFRIKSKKEYAHRISYEMAYGPITDSLYVCHHCDNPPCVNSEHLFLGTQKDNMKDASNKKRVIGSKCSMNKGSENNQAKLTETQVVSIIKDTRIHRKIAKDYKVNRSTISFIKRGDTWKHIKRSKE